MQHPYYTLMAYKPFEPSPPTAPNELSKAAISSLWGTIGWVLAVVAAFALAGACFLAFKHRGQGGQNEATEKAAWVLGGCVAFGLVLGIVGTVTGT